MPARLRELVGLLGQRSLLVLWAAQLLSQLGDYASRIALALLIYERSGSALSAAAVTAVSLLPWLGVGQLLGTAADRFSHRRVMMVCDGARAVLYLALALTHLPVVPLLVVVFLAGCFDPPFDASRSAALPQLAGERYGSALVLFNSTTQAALLGGFALGGLLTAATSPVAALVLNAGTFAVGVGLAAALPATTSAQEQEEHLPALETLRRGTAALLGDRLVTVAAGVVTVSALGGVAAEATVTAYAHHLGGHGTMAGLLATVAPLAALLAAPLLPSASAPVRTVRQLCALAIGINVLAAALLLTDPPLPVVVVAFAAIGVLQLTTIPAGAVIGTRLPRRTRGTSFAVLEGSLQSFQAAGALLAGLLAAAVGAPLAVALTCVPAAAAGVVGLAAVARTAEPDPAEEGATATA